MLKSFFIFAIRILKQKNDSYPVKEGEVIDRALKRFKKKFMKTGTLKEIRGRKEYIKKSQRLRNQKQKAYSAKILRVKNKIYLI